ncbi:uncharacterized protein [Macaca nemestrina]|uniref:uncharacterized protein n=1 Tax=Macaca nemestrina TaxID=9545 RepID=UPI0039B8F2A2
MQGTRGPVRVPAGRGTGSPGPAHGAAGRWCPPRAVRGLAPRPVAAEVAPGPPAGPAHQHCTQILKFSQGLAASPRGRARDLQPAMSELPPAVGSCAEPPRRAPPRVPRRLVPWTAQGLRSARAARDWRAAPGAGSSG